MTLRTRVRIIWYSYYFFFFSRQWFKFLWSCPRSCLCNMKVTFFPHEFVYRIRAIAKMRRFFSLWNLRRAHECPSIFHIILELFFFTDRKYRVYILALKIIIGSTRIFKCFYDTLLRCYVIRTNESASDSWKIKYLRNFLRKKKQKNRP